MFVYIIETGQNVDIKTPFEMTDRKLEQFNDLTVNTSTYENGWTLTMKQYADRIEVISNKELIQDSDGFYVIKE